MNKASQDDENRGMRLSWFIGKPVVVARQARSNLLFAQLAIEFEFLGRDESLHFFQPQVELSESMPQ